MKIDYLTLFPEMFDGVLNHSIMKRAQENNKLQINTVNFRDYAINKHNQVDDYPYGGGQGMVLKPEPVFNAMEDLDVTEQTRVILMCPQGEPFSHQKAVELSKADHIVSYADIMKVTMNVSERILSQMKYQWVTMF